MPHATATVVIQTFTEAHVAGVTALYSDPAVCRQTLQLPYPSPDLWRQRLAAASDRSIKLVALHEGAVVGNIGLEQYARIRQRHVGTFGMGVAHAWQGQGVGSQLLAAALDIADNWMHLHRVELTVFADNEGAIALYKKFGFEIEGRLRDYAVRDGQWVDALSMARLASQQP